MHTYYQRYSVDWDVQLIEEKTRDLENYDILLRGDVVGVFRLQYEEDCCYLRDLQVDASYQNRGIGQTVLNEVKRHTLQAKLHTLRLRVFKISPALELYKRNGFVIKEEDERFFNLELSI